MFHVEIHIDGLPHYLTEHGIKPVADCTKHEADEHHYLIKQFSTMENATAAYYATKTPFPGFVCNGTAKHHIAI